MADVFDTMPDVDLLARLIYGEARGEGAMGKLAVACVAMNRAAKPGWWGRTLKEVILKPYQFSCFNAEYRDILIAPTGAIWDVCRSVASGVISGITVDPTNGATHFYADTIAAPSWAASMVETAHIGHHIFLAAQAGEVIPVAERISDGAKRFNVFIERGTPKDGKIYRIKDIFTTLNGSWEPSGQVGSIPQWARDTYLRPWGAPDYFDDAGADHHVLGGIFNEATGRMVNGLNATTIHYYTATDNSNHVDLIAKEKSGWANNIVFNKFNPGAGERGAWAWYPKSNIPADVVVGGGLPDGWHVSFFATWVLSDGVTVPPVDPPDPDPTTDARIVKLETWARAVSAHFAGSPKYD